MKIALMGTRGIPAAYSGFETCVEQLGQRLVERGHEVTVYCRVPHITYAGDTYKGMRLVKLRAIGNMFLDTIIHSFLSTLHGLTQRYDVILYFIAGNSPVTWIQRLVGTKTAHNVDRLDWKRAKWPNWAKKYLQLSEFLATKLPNAVVTDSRIVQDYYETRFNSHSTYIPYGSEVEILPPGETLARFGLQSRRYILFVGRLVPENCIHHILGAFHQTKTDLQCVIVGDAPYSNQYKARLRQMAEGDPRIIFTGYVFGQGYHELGSNALIFIESSGVGGTHPALTEAMAFGNCVIVNDTPENLETIGEAGFSYAGELGADSLRVVLQELLDQPDKVASYRHLAQARARAHYSWEAITDAYEALFQQLCPRPTQLDKEPAQHSQP